MRTLDIVRRARRSLGSAKARTVLTSLAIGVGAFTLTLAIAAGQGARDYVDTLLTTNVDPQVLAIAKDPQIFQGGQTGPQLYDPDATLQQRPTGNAVIKQLTQEDINSIAERSDITSVSPKYTINAQYITRSNEKKYTADVVQYDSGVTQTVVAGNLPPLRSMIADDSVSLPEAYVSLLGFTDAQDAVGKSVTIHLTRTSTLTSEEIQQAVAGGAAALQQLASPVTKDINLKIVAIVGKSATALTDTTTVGVSNNIARDLSDFSTEGTSSYHKYNLATASVKEGTDPEVVKQALIKEGYGVKTARDIQSILFTFVNVLQGIVIGFGILALITSVFGIINTQYISVLERTREIGLMKALGMRGRHVSRLFQFEAAWIGFLGGIIGSLLAVVAGLILNPWITDMLTLGDGNYLLVFQPLPIGALIVALMLIAMLAGYFPARRAAKLDPIEALRTE